MTSVREAENLIQRNLPQYPAVSCPLVRSSGRTLRETIRSDRDWPPFDKSLVDGVAIRLSAYEKGLRRFHIQAIQPAGKPPTRLRKESYCIEIMTGAARPSGCDCVIPVENVQPEGSDILLPDGLKLRSMQFLRRKAADHRKGEVLFRPGAVLDPVRIAAAASVGKIRLKVTSLPRIAIIATGDELVSVEKHPTPYQVRMSNSYGVRAVLEGAGFPDVQLFHFRDDLQLLRRELRAILNKFDVLVLSGGVSMGKFDYVPRVLADLKVEKIFHKVAQRPGRPFWFGRSRLGRLVFALPGNPASTIVCAYRYVVPALKKAVGKKGRLDSHVVLGEGIGADPSLTLFLPVKIFQGTKGKTFVRQVEYGGSGDFGALGRGDGFVELAPRLRPYPRGTVVPLWLW